MKDKILLIALIITLLMWSYVVFEMYNPTLETIMGIK